MSFRRLGEISEIVLPVSFQPRVFTALHSIQNDNDSLLLIAEHY